MSELRYVECLHAEDATAFLLRGKLEIPCRIFEWSPGEWDRIQAAEHPIFMPTTEERRDTIVPEHAYERWPWEREL